MNLSSIMKVKDDAVRKVLYEEWQKDQVWKKDIERRLDELERSKRSVNAVGYPIVGPNTSSFEMAFPRLYSGGEKPP